MFDLDADIGGIGEHLVRDPLLAPLVAARPGLGIVGSWDGFELAARALLGQQVTVEAGRRLAANLVDRCATDESVRGGLSSGLVRTFPEPSRVACADVDPVPMPKARKRALHELAKASLAHPRLFVSLASAEQTVSRLVAIPGIGEWTGQYIALRAAADPDAFPATDAVLLRSIAALEAAVTSRQLLARAEGWRPWRGYVAQHLWAADQGGAETSEERHVFSRSPVARRSQNTPGQIRVVGRR